MSFPIYESDGFEPGEEGFLRSKDDFALGVAGFEPNKQKYVCDN